MRRAIRRFSLLDVLILIAAMGLEFTAILAVQAILRGMRVSQITFDSYSIWFILASPVVGMGCLILLIAAFSRPEVRRRREFRKPGITASCTFWIVFFGANWGFVRLNPSILTHPNPGAIHILWDLASSYAGLSVLAVWIVQALAGWWRPVPTWIDRAGRLAGIFWIAAYIIRAWNI
jgi:hypothetical protein